MIPTPHASRSPRRWARFDACLGRARRLIVSAALAVAALSPGGAHGQPAATVVEGDRVRLRVASDPSRQLVGELMHIDAASITLWLDVAHHASRRLELPRAGILRLERAIQVEVSGDGVERAIAGPFVVAGITAATALVGAAAGMGVERIVAGDPCGNDGFLCIPTGAAVGFVAGALAGVGISIWVLQQPSTQERWLPAQLPEADSERSDGHPPARWGAAVTVRF